MPRRDYANTSILTQRAEKRAKQKWRLTVLHWAIMVSLAIHAFLLTVRFVDPERFNKIFKDTPLEVILVNARSDERPVQAQALAQTNLAGGGEAVSGRATSPLPPAPTVEVGDSLEEARRQVERMQEVQQQLLAQIRRDLALLPPPDPRREAGTPEEREREERRRQLLRQLAEIEKRVNEENARPKKRYISPATLEAEDAIWYDAFKRRVEDRGTRDFPEQNGRKLYGELIMNITIDAEGRVVEADIVRPSSSRLLDRRA
jgi:protein TonB